MNLPIILNPLLKEEQDKKKYDYVYLSLDFSEIIRDAIEAVQNTIPEDWIYGTSEDGFGKEKEPHVTIFYGLLPSEELNHNQDMQFLHTMQYINSLEEEPSITTETVSYFSSEGYDVIIIPVVSPILEKTHAFIKDNFLVEETHDEYKPHITIAYVKKGHAEDYKNIDLHIPKIIFSGKEVKYKFTDSTIFSCDSD
jgi:2'-5' RNA ligase